MKTALPLSLLLIAGAAQAADVEISIERIGLVDFAHTRFPGYYHYSILTTGQGLQSVRPDMTVVAGRADNYENSPYYSRDAWYYDGSTTQIVGLLDAEHTNSNLGGTRLQGAGFVNGQAVVGVANRYSATGSGLGNSSWYFDGLTTSRIGLIDAEHTSSSSGSRFSSPRGLSATGTAFGESNRYDASGFSSGSSVWAADASGTSRIGLFDSNHTRVSDGFRSSELVQFNDAGQAIGASNRYSATGFPEGSSAWLYDGFSTFAVGVLDDPLASSVTNRALALNASGQVAGQATGGTAGSTAWVYDGAQTVQLGLADAEHTHPASGGRYSQSAGVINSSGHSMGTSVRYAGDGRNIGQSAWVYDGVTTHKAGLTDAEHTGSLGSIADQQINEAELLSDSGAAAGTARRYNSLTGNVVGQSTWVFDGNATIRTGLFDANHTRVTDNYRESENQAINGAGQVLGRSDQFDAAGNAIGQSVWLWNGAATQNIGPTGGQFVNAATGGSWSNAYHLNEQGQVAGTASTFGVGGISLNGTAAWFFDGASTVVLDPAATGSSIFNEYDASQFSFKSTINYLSDDGLILGKNEVFTEHGAYIDQHLFGYRDDWGLFEFEVELDGSPEYIQQFWSSLDSISAVNGSSELFGQGTTLSGGQMAFKITVVPVPAAFWLMLSAIGVLSLRRRAAGA